MWQLTSLTLAPRVPVDVNRLGGPDGTWAVCGATPELLRLRPGDRVLAVEHEEEGPDYVAFATVAATDVDQELVHLLVNWAEMRPDPTYLSREHGPRLQPGKFQVFVAARQDDPAWGSSPVFRLHREGVDVGVRS